MKIARRKPMVLILKSLFILPFLYYLSYLNDDGFPVMEDRFTCTVTATGEPCTEEDIARNRSNDVEEGFVGQQYKPEKMIRDLYIINLSRINLCKNIF